VIRTCLSCGSKNRIPPSRLGDIARCGRCKTQLPTLGEPVHVDSAREFDELVSASPLPVLVDFWAGWCGPCRMVAPELEKLARARSGEVVVAKVDTEALPDIAGRYGIRSIPTLIVFRGGREDRRVSGAMGAPQIQAQLGL